MNIELIQAWVKGLIQANAALTAGAVPIFSDDGALLPKDREEKLRTKGMIIIVWEPDSDGGSDISKSGAGVMGIYVPVLVEENVSVNRVTGGTGIVALAAARHVLGACSGKRPSNVSPFVLMPQSAPFKNFSFVNGVRHVLVNLEIQSRIAVE